MSGAVEQIIFARERAVQGRPLLKPPVLGAVKK